MNHTEDDLRELLAERTAYGPGGGMDVAEIVRRGRRGRLVRWGAGAALAGAAATVVIWALPSPVTTPAPAPAAQPVAPETPSSVASAAPSNAAPSNAAPSNAAPSNAAPSDAAPSDAALSRVSDPPVSIDGLTRIGAVLNTMSATGTDMKVEPTHHATTVVVTCANPQSWVVTAVKGSRAG
ncbi:hypothetical protein ABZ912_13170 [Nonomuraea angiospora]|uniref:hypothetical protein n=1 Tax=Nonomuraea angiospora TaxID=46172 RepID=UPI0033EB6A45